MSKASDLFNAYPLETRTVLRVVLLERELQLISMEKARLAADYRSAVQAHTDRYNAIQTEIDKEYQQVVSLSE